MILSLIFSLILIIFQVIGLFNFDGLINLIKDIDFKETLMSGMLSFLLFAGALHVNINDLTKEKWVILVLATIGVFSSTLLVGYITYLIITYFSFFPNADSYSLLIYSL